MVPTALWIPEIVIAIVYIYQGPRPLYVSDPIMALQCGQSRLPGFAKTISC